MAKSIHDVKVTVEEEGITHIYTAPSGVLSGGVHGGVPSHAINLMNSVHTKFLSTAEVKGYSITEPDDERKKLIKNHASVLTDVLKAAEAARLNSAIKRERMEQEIAAQERADRITIMFAVNNAIQAGLSEEEVTADMCDGWASYVCDMYGHVYTATDLDTVVNKK